MRIRLVSACAAAALTGAIMLAAAVPAPPAAAIPVFDASNYAQNILTAARALSQINNQIQSLQNEAKMLINQAKNLSRIDFPQLQEIRQKLQEIDRLMGQAQGIDYRLGNLGQRFDQLFPQDMTQLASRDQRVASARAQLNVAMSAFRQTMGVQSQIVGNLQGDAETLAAIVERSQGAEGSLQVSQATNQLLALTAKQQIQIQTLMASQFRAEAIDQARRGQIESEARGARARFLGDGKAYTPTP